MFVSSRQADAASLQHHPVQSKSRDAQLQLQLQRAASSEPSSLRSSSDEKISISQSLKFDKDCTLSAISSSLE